MITSISKSVAYGMTKIDSNLFADCWTRVGGEGIVVVEGLGSWHGLHFDHIFMQMVGQV